MTKEYPKQISEFIMSYMKKELMFFENVYTYFYLLMSESIFSTKQKI